MAQLDADLDRQMADLDRQVNSAMEQSRKETERIRKQIEADMAAAAKGPPRLPLLEENAMVTLRVPKEAEPLPLILKLSKRHQAGRMLGSSGSPLTVIEDCEDERVPVRWDTQNRESLIHRSQLIIRKVDLKQLKLTLAKSQSRTWKDASGKFSIDAVLVTKAATTITLKKEDGKEVTLPITKLSKEDQAWIKENL